MILQSIELFLKVAEDMEEPIAYIPLGLLVGLFCLAGKWILENAFPSRFRKSGNKGVFFLTASYIGVILFLTIFSRESGSRTRIDLEIFCTWGNSLLPHEYFVENILMFIPFGFLFPMILPVMKRGRSCVLGAFLFSFFLEFTQLVTGRGYWQVDDLLTNTLGGWIGWMIFRAGSAAWEKRTRGLPEREA